MIERRGEAGQAGVFFTSLLISYIENLIITTNTHTALHELCHFT